MQFRIVLWLNAQSLDKNMYKDALKQARHYETKMFW